MRGKNNEKTIKKIVWSFLCLFVISTLSGCASQKKIDLDAGTTLFFEGFNGKGSGIVDTTMIDDLGLEAKMLELSEKTLTLMLEGKSYDKVEQQYTKLYEFARSLSCSWDSKNGSYVNGDEAIYSCSFDAEAAKKLVTRILIPNQDTLWKA